MLSYPAFFTKWILMPIKIRAIQRVKQEQGMLVTYQEMTGSTKPTQCWELILPVMSCAWLLSGARLFAIPMDCSPPDSSVHGILQARILEWVAISSSRGSSWPKIRTCVSCISCIGRWILYHRVTCEALHLSICHLKFTLSDPFSPFMYIYYLSIFEEFNSDSSLL